MKLDVDESNGPDCDSFLVTAPWPGVTWRRRYEATSAPVAPKLHDAILGLPRDDALRRAYLRRLWSEHQSKTGLVAFP